MKSVCRECPNCLITESFIEQQGFSRLSTCSDVARAVPKVFRAAKKHRRPRIQATMTTNVFYFSFIPEKERQRHGKLGMENCSPAIWQVFIFLVTPIVQDGNFWAVVADSTTEGWWKFLKNSASGSSF